MIVRWGLDELGPLLRELELASPLLVTSERLGSLDLPVERRFTGVRPHTPADSVEAALSAAGGADGLVALGGGSAIDTAKNVSAATGLPVVSVPTTYSGSEWTTYFGRRDEERGVKGGGGGARTSAIIYEPRLTLELPHDLSAGTAMNALAHCAEALYVEGRSDEGDRAALEGARLISRWLPVVLADGGDLEARMQLLRGAAHAGAALAASFMGLAHAAAQALGGRYGLPHGAMNALTLPPVLRFNEPVVAGALSRLGEALGGEAALRARELAGLGGFHRLRDFGVPREELGDVAEATVTRPAARANPRQAGVEDVTRLLESAW